MIFNPVIDEDATLEEQGKEVEAHLILVQLPEASYIIETESRDATDEVIFVQLPPWTAQSKLQEQQEQDDDDDDVMVREIDTSVNNFNPIWQFVESTQFLGRLDEMRECSFESDSKVFNPIILDIDGASSGRIDDDCITREDNSEFTAQQELPPLTDADLP